MPASAPGVRGPPISQSPRRDTTARDLREGPDDDDPAGRPGARCARRRARAGDRGRHLQPPVRRLRRQGRQCVAEAGEVTTTRRRPRCAWWRPRKMLESPCWRKTAPKNRPRSALGRGFRMSQPVSVGPLCHDHCTDECVLIRTDPNVATGPNTGRAAWKSRAPPPAGVGGALPARRSRKSRRCHRSNPRTSGA
jgi:hypothetical protein